VSELPRTPSGKVQKFMLRERFARELGQAGGLA
jgi:cyclohexanecarboxylate-CoA ligase/acyl-CoA synthetase